MSEKDETELENLRRLLDVSQECVRDLRARLAAAVPHLSAVISDAPCSACGYNGPSYYQPETHTCVKQPADDRLPKDAPIPTLEELREILRHSSGNRAA